MIHKPHFIAGCFFIHGHLQCPTVDIHALQELSVTFLIFCPVKFIKIPTTLQFPVQKIHSATYRKQEGCHIK